MEDSDLHEQQAVRRAKLTDLRAHQIEPYPARLPRERTHTAAEALAAYQNGEFAEGQVVTLVGRLLTLRIMGKA